MLSFKMSEAQAVNIHKLADMECRNLKNHIAFYVEQGNFDKAKELVEQLRQHQALFAVFNRDAAHEIAAATDKPVETTRIVADRQR